MTDQRRAQAKAWVAEQLALPAFGACALATFEAASADASFRRYFRAADAAGRSWIVMDAPPEVEPVADFVDIAGRLAQAGIAAPRVLAQHPQDGFLLLTDLGACTMLSVLERTDNAPVAQRADRLYGQALEWLVALQVGVAADALPAYDATRLGDEMQLFEDWFVQRHLGQRLSARHGANWAAAKAMLIEDALTQPQVFVHRDYHSRNLMAAPQQDALSGMLDFQDAVKGPLLYDVVSLLKDCYITWPQAQRTAWLTRWLSGVQEAGLGADITLAQAQRWFDWIGLQRHLKVLGIFARLHYRDGKSNYLNDLPMVLAYVREVLPRYPEWSGLQALFEETVWPHV